jgi:acetoin utilization deacetylase AcuC-like enzyme
MNHLRSLSEDGTVRVESDFPLCDRELLEQVHAAKYVEFVYSLGTEMTQTKPVHFSPLLLKAMDLDAFAVPRDTFFSKGSLDAAVRAAGAVVVRYIV